MPTESFTFPGHDGALLAGRLDLPEGTPRAAALFAHCFTCTKDSHAARRISPPWISACTASQRQRSRSPSEPASSAAASGAARLPR